MHLTTLVDILEREIGGTASGRANLAELLAERGHAEDAADQARIARRLERQGNGKSGSRGR